MILSNLRYMAIKKEETAGTFLSPANADFDIKFQNIAMSPTIAMDDEAAKFGTGNHNEQESVAGARMANITASVRCNFNSGAAIATAPKWWKAMNACGLKTLTYAGTGVSLVGRKELDNSTYSIVVYDVEIGASPVTTEHRFAGCVGNVIWGADATGAPYIAQFTFQGKYVGTVAGSAIALTAPDTGIPRTFSGEVNCTYASSTGSEGLSVSPLVNSFQLDLGNNIQPVRSQADATGYSHFAITQRAPRISINPLALKSASWDVFKDITGNSLGALVFGKTGEVTLKGIAAQIITAGVSQREGFEAYDMTLKLTGNNITGTKIDAALEDEDTFELLQGARA
jgi:hypothetical protein